MGTPDESPPSTQGFVPRATMGPTSSRRLRGLIVDDEPNIRTTLSVCLEALDCEARIAGGPREALAAAEQTPFDIAFVDLRLGARDGIDLVPDLLRLAPGLTVVMITAYANVESAVRAMKAGARDYLPKPFTLAQIRHVVEHFRQRRYLENRVHDLEERLSGSVPEVLLETSSRAMQAAIDTTVQAAETDTAVMFKGESGTGKGVLARFLHILGRRASSRFVTVSCPTLTDELLASELFGHVRGSFTGAVRDQRGKVEEAHGGTLFLDEIGEISGGLQSKLLRFVQDKDFERIGESRTRRADVRIVTATNRDLDADVALGRFRLDLLYRLNVIEIRVPALRERREDILRLARHFLGFFAASLGRSVPELTQEAESLLVGYAWPGNVREVRNEMERAIALGRGHALLPESFSERVRGATNLIPAVGGEFTLHQIEREHTLRVLAHAATREEAARVLGIDPSTLWRRLRRYETDEDPTSEAS